MHFPNLLKSLLLLAGAAWVASPAFAQKLHEDVGYTQTVLVANKKEYNPQIVDERMRDAWGIALRPPGAGGHLWISNAGTGTSSEFIGDVPGEALHQDGLKIVELDQPRWTDHGHAYITGQALTEASNTRAKAAENRLAEVQKNLQKAEGRTQTLEASSQEAQRILQAAKDEEKALRKGMPGLSAETALAQKELKDVLAQRTIAETRLATLTSEVSKLEERLTAAQRDLAAIEQTRTIATQAHAEKKQQVAELESRCQALLSEKATAEGHVSTLNAQRAEREKELTSYKESLTARVEELRQEEERIADSIRSKRDQLQSAETGFEDLQKKVEVLQARHAEFVSNGPRIQSLNDSIAQLEAKHRDLSQKVSSSSEDELSQHVKLTALQETIAAESKRLDQIRREREIEEKDRRAALDKAQKEFQTSQESQKEDLKQAELSTMGRLKDRIKELEDKHEALRKSLSKATDESTVIMFAQDLIKRLDLIDLLIQKYSSTEANGNVEKQLLTLRCSFEDILAQHGVVPYSVPAGTEVDMDLRHRISVVESNVTRTKAKAKVVASFRPGFLYQPHGKQEVILRKVEVKTSSE